MSIWSSIGNFVGGIFGGASSSAMNAASAVISNKQQYDYATKLNNQTYQHNIALQNHQNQFSAQMANTSYQRGVADMRAAGINPMLAISNGGSMSPVGGSAGMSSSSFNGADYGLGEGVTSALQFRQQRNQDKLTKEQTENLKADSYLKGNQANTESEKFNTQVEQTRQLKQSIINDTAVAAAQVKNLQAQSTASLINALSNRNLSSAQAWRARHQALGFSKSESYSNSTGGSVRTPMFGHSRNSGSSYNNSSSW